MRSFIRRGFAFTMSLAPRGQTGSSATSKDYELTMGHYFVHSKVIYRQSPTPTAVTKATILRQLAIHSEWADAQLDAATFEEGWLLCQQG